MSLKDHSEIEETQQMGIKPCSEDKRQFAGLAASAV